LPVVFGNSDGWSFFSDEFPVVPILLQIPDLIPAVSAVHFVTFSN
jgi:hypothetical protein